MTLLARLHALIERTYDMGLGGLDPAAYLIGDAGFGELFANLAREQPRRAMLLVRSTRAGPRACVYYPDRLIANLERHDPSRRLSEENLRDFATFVEELDHLLLLLACARRGRPVRGFELELHANVTKVLCASLFLARTLGAHRLTMEQRGALRVELLERGDYEGETHLRSRYLDARRHGLRFLDRLERAPAVERPALLRTFSRASLPEKLHLCA